MAFTLDQVRQEMQTSIHGRRLALDPDGALVGPTQLRLAVQDITTVPTTVNGYGTVRGTATGSSQGPTQHFLPVPKAGQEVMLVNGTSSTGSIQFLSTANGAAIRGSSLGTTAGVVNLLYAHAFVKLRAMSSALWQVVGRSGWASTALADSISFTTST